MKKDRLVSVSMSIADIRALCTALACVGGHEPLKSAAPHARRLETLRHRLDLAVTEADLGLRCRSVHDDLRCGLAAGHDGPHSALTPSGAPWMGQ